MKGKGKRLAEAAEPAGRGSTSKEEEEEEVGAVSKSAKCHPPADETHPPADETQKFLFEVKISKTEWELYPETFKEKLQAALIYDEHGIYVNEEHGIYVNEHDELTLLPPDKRGTQ